MTRNSSAPFFVTSLILFGASVVWSFGPGEAVIGIGGTILALLFFGMGIIKASQIQAEDEQDIEEQKAG